MEVQLKHLIVNVMEGEKKKILDKINGQIDKIRNRLLDKFPAIHEIEDGFIIRFFTKWDSCDENTKIRYKKIANRSNPDEKTVFFFIPKGAYIVNKKRDYIGCLTCINGQLELVVNNKMIYLDAYTKTCLDTNEFHGRALENTYLITTSVN